MSKSSAMELRPYRLLCAICSLGARDSVVAGEKEKNLLKAVAQAPDMPVTLSCKVGEVFAYQDPDAADDTPEGAEFNVKRDLEILHKLNLSPGCTLPARIIFSRVLDTIENLSGICSYPTVTSDCWKGCPKADGDAYERGRGLGIGAIIPVRDGNEMAVDKVESLAAMHKSEAIRIRPHMLLCAVCQYGGGIRPPFPEDNLPELVELVLKAPDRLLEMAPNAEWMMCAACPCRAPRLNGCVNNKGAGGLPNQMRDLRVLQKLGLNYGSTIKARDLYARIFERISGTLEICRIEHSRPSVWWTGCGAATANSENYDKGRAMLVAAMRL